MKRSILPFILCTFAAALLCGCTDQSGSASAPQRIESPSSAPGNMIDGGSGRMGVDTGAGTTAPGSGVGDATGGF